MKKYYTRHEPIQLKNATKIHHETQSTQHHFKEKSKWTPLTTDNPKLENYIETTKLALLNIPLNKRVKQNMIRAEKNASKT